MTILNLGMPQIVTAKQFVPKDRHEESLLAVQRSLEIRLT